MGKRQPQHNTYVYAITQTQTRVKHTQHDTYVCAITQTQTWVKDNLNTTLMFTLSLKLKHG